MIRTFQSKETKYLFERRKVRKIPRSIQRAALRKLWMLDSAGQLTDLKSPPANHLEKLRGDRHGQYSIRINDRWRICFEWKDSNAYNVEIIDYH